MKTFHDLTKQERSKIAEFIFAIECGTLIKQEAFQVIDVIEKTSMFDDADYLRTGVDLNREGVIDKIVEILDENIDDETSRKIMSEFFKKSV